MVEKSWYRLRNCYRRHTLCGKNGIQHLLTKAIKDVVRR
ncbi:hypothetical protein MicloDRAFT_00008710 [Microvirga lotononidis]|uniref:Uncharacterized protein n=1 Tax=Microvirga lotononidis TaxID=864069 RepID=I4Z279_9HYPH|nr:hypothetical protein MicloDRAFT_00008710 [Microvirga lotononidis]